MVILKWDMSHFCNRSRVAHLGEEDGVAGSTLLELAEDLPGVRARRPNIKC